jgi:hypothetical protein
MVSLQENIVEPHVGRGTKLDFGFRMSAIIRSQGQLTGEVMDILKTQP